MQVRTTKDQGLYNKPSAAMHPGALAAETLPQYSTISTDTVSHSGRKIFINTAVRTSYFASLSSAKTLVPRNDEQYNGIHQLFSQVHKDGG